MGKIGDLWIRLGLKSEGVKEGLNQAVTDTKEAGEKMGGHFDKLKGIGVGVFGAIAAVAAKTFKDAIDNSQKLGDAFARATAKMDGAWKTFISSLTSFNWENFGSRIRSAIDASGALYDIKDRQFEVDNATKLAMAATQKRRLELEETARSTTASAQERQAAIAELRNILKPIYENAANQASDLLNATVNSFNAKSGTKFTNDQLEKALIAIGTVGDLADIMSRAGTHTEFNGTTGMTTVAGAMTGTSTTARQVNNLTDEEVRKLREASQSLGFDLEEFARVYNEMNGDKTIKELVDSFTGFYAAANQLDADMKRYDILANNLNGKSGGGGGISAAAEPAFVRPEWGEQLQVVTNGLENMKQAMTDVSMAQRELFKPEGWDEYIAFLQEMAAVTEEAAMMIEDAIIDGIGDSLQYLTDAMFGLEDLNGAQLFGALLSPLADACVQIGKAIMATGLASEAFQKSLTNPYAAIAAGAALMAVGAAAKSAISSSIGSVTGAYPQTGADSTSTASTPYSGKLTINVTGNIQGDTIAITGQRAINNWNR